MSEAIITYLYINIVFWLGLGLLHFMFFGSESYFQKAPKKLLLSFARISFVVCLFAPILVPTIKSESPIPIPSTLSFNVLSESPNSQSQVTENTKPLDNDSTYVVSPPSYGLSPIAILLLTYLFGVLVFGLRFISNLKKLGSLIECAILYRKTKSSRVYFSDQVQIPISFYRFGYSNIFLPVGSIEQPKHVRLSLAHEAQHIRQYDIHWAYLIEILKIIFWWNPAVFLWQNKLEFLAEVSCDEQIILRKHSDRTSRDYAYCLVSFAEKALMAPKYHSIASSMAAHTKPNTLSRRIKMFSNIDRSSRSSRYHGLKAIALLAVLICSSIALKVRAENEEIQVDSRLQNIVDEALTSGLNKHQAKSGFAILADPQSGQVLAVARQVADGGRYKKVAATDFLKTPIEPASLLKPVIAAVALEKAVVDENTVLDALGGKVQFGKRYFHDWKDHGKLTMAEAIANSSFVGTIRIAQLVGEKDLLSGMKRFGIGERIQNSGSILDRTGTVQLKTGSDAEYNLPFVANGAGVVFLTVEDVLRVYSAFSNGGKLLGLSDFDSSNSKTKVLSQPISEQTARRIKHILLQTMQTGTGKWAQSSKYTIMGKTATSYVVPPSKDKDYNHATRAQFVGFAPYENPRLISLVVVDYPQGPAHGSTHAAPIVRSILNQGLKLLNVDSDRTVSEN